jgi:transposase-like protein
MDISVARHHFPHDIIQHAVWLYLRFTLSFRDVEDLLAERGLDLSYETVRRWVLKFGPLFAKELPRGRHRPKGLALRERRTRSHILCGMERLAASHVGVRRRQTGATTGVTNHHGKHSR